FVCCPKVLSGPPLLPPVRRITRWPPRPGPPSPRSPRPPGPAPAPPPPRAPPTPPPPPPTPPPRPPTHPPPPPHPPPRPTAAAAPALATWKPSPARAWPTLVLIAPEGYIVGHMAGEGHTPNIAATIEQLVAEHEARGTLHRGSGPYVAPEPTAGLLKFPAKAVALPNGNLLVADAGHHRLVELEPDGETLVRTIGSGSRGRTDGGPDVAELNEPNGLCLLPGDV